MCLQHHAQRELHPAYVVNQTPGTRKPDSLQITSCLMRTCVCGLGSVHDMHLTPTHTNVLFMRTKPCSQSTTHSATWLVATAMTYTQLYRTHTSSYDTSLATWRDMPALHTQTAGPTVVYWLVAQPNTQPIQTLMLFAICHSPTLHPRCTALACACCHPTASDANR
jgi:hypothetical protein